MVSAPLSSTITLSSTTRSAKNPLWTQNRVVDYGDGLLASDVQSALFQLVSQSRLINGLEQPGSQRRMDPISRIDDVLPNSVFVHSLSYLRSLRLP